MSLSKKVSPVDGFGKVTRPATFCKKESLNNISLQIGVCCAGAIVKTLKHCLLQCSFAQEFGNDVLRRIVTPNSASNLTWAVTITGKDSFVEDYCPYDVKEISVFLRVQSSLWKMFG